MENKYTGWREGFGSVLDDQLGVETQQKVLDQCKFCQKISNDKDMAKCVKGIMIQFDQVVPYKEKRYGVMEKMGKFCFNKYFAKTAELVKEKSNKIAELTQNLNYF